MARLFFPGSGDPPVTPAFSAGWEDTLIAVRKPLVNAKRVVPTQRRFIARLVRNGKVVKQTKAIEVTNDAGGTKVTFDMPVICQEGDVLTFYLPVSPARRRRKAQP